MTELIDLNPKQTSFVFDADALWYLANDVQIKELVMKLQSSSGNVVLTPNLIEFKRMYGGEVPTVNEELEFFRSTGESTFGEVPISHAVVEPVAALARQFGNARICRKGLTDIVTDGLKAYYVKETGSLKRCGGIGDILAGTIGTFTHYG